MQLKKPKGSAALRIELDGADGQHETTAVQPGGTITGRVLRDVVVHKAQASPRLTVSIRLIGRVKARMTSTSLLTPNP